MLKLLDNVPLISDPDIKLSMFFGKTKNPDYIGAVITLTAPKNVRAEGNEYLFAALVHSKMKVERMAPVGTSAIDLAYTEDSFTNWVTLSISSGRFERS